MDGASVRIDRGDCKCTRKAVLVQARALPTRGANSQPALSISSLTFRRRIHGNGRVNAIPTCEKVWMSTFGWFVSELLTMRPYRSLLKGRTVTRRPCTVAVSL